jgi:anti-sigma factor RsiW
MRWELLDRYLLHECSPAERAQVEQWLAKSPARRKLLEQLSRSEATDSTASRARKAEVWARLELELDQGLKLSGDDA